MHERLEVLITILYLKGISTDARIPAKARRP
jgi:hypothetical protein